VASDFAGETGRLYARYRRDLPKEQAARLARRLGLLPDDVVVDLGSGTGQLGVPLLEHCAAVVAVEPEPEMLRGLRERGVPGVACMLGSDSDLPLLSDLIVKPVGAVVIGNALHWMDEAAALQRCASLPRPGGVVAVVTQGPPLWQGSAPWQFRVRTVLERALGQVSGTCGSDAAALDRRARMLGELGLDVSVSTWHASYAVDIDWVIGHLGSALAAGSLQQGRPSGLAGKLRAVLEENDPFELVEDVTTTAVIGRLPS
jgi:SAM-dependent methyltransferase